MRVALTELKRPEIFGGRHLRKFLGEPNEDSQAGKATPTARVDNAGEADLVSSDCGPYHMPVIDLDVPASLVPSATPGHSHLYIDVAMTWEVYEKLLSALVDAGVVEPGYLGASRERGFTAVRVPWKPKGVKR